MGIALSGECCHVSDDDVHANTPKSSTTRGQQQQELRTLPLRSPAVSTAERTCDAPRQNPLNSPTKDAAAVPSSHNNSSVLTPSAPHLLLTSGNSDTPFVSSMDSEPGAQRNGQQAPPQQMPFRSPTKSNAKSPMRGNVFTTIKGVPMATLAATVFIHQDDDAPPAPAQHHALPYVFNTEELDFAADDEADEEETALVMGERICRATSRHRLNGSQMSGTYSVDLGSQSSRRRSRESAVTWDRAIFPCAADDEDGVDDIICGDGVGQPDEAIAPAAHPADVMGMCYNDDVVFPTHNVFTPPLRPAGAGSATNSSQQPLSLQEECDAPGYHSLGDGGGWSEAELAPIIASPRRERQRVLIPSHLLSSTEDAATIQPPLASPTGACDVDLQMDLSAEGASPRLWELPQSLQHQQMSQSLDEEVVVSASRVVKHVVALKTRPLDWSSGRAPRRQTLVPSDALAQPPQLSQPSM